MKSEIIPMTVQVQVNKLLTELTLHGGGWRRLGGHKLRRYQGAKQPIAFALPEGYSLFAYLSRGQFTEFNVISPSAKRRLRRKGRR